MANSSSSKKVQRAARAAASSRGASERRELGFPLILGVIVVLGVILVFAANREQDDQIAAQPELTDHWHAAYSLYDCGDGYLDPWFSQDDPDGIHSHQDSVIHVHPFTSAVTGDRAQISVFLDAMDADLNEERLESGQHGVIDTSSDCEGEATAWRVGRFRVDPEVEIVEVYDTDLESVQFDRDREAFVFARVPVGLADEDFPVPTDEALEALDNVTGEIEDPNVPVIGDPDAGADDPAEGTGDTGSEGSDTGTGDTGSEGSDTGTGDTGSEGSDTGTGDTGSEGSDTGTEGDG